MKNLYYTVIYSILSLGTCFTQQNILISQGGSVSVNNGDKFYDAGGPSGNDGNTDYTITLIPAVTEEVICIDFTSFITEMDSWGGINGADKLEIFDGPNTSSTNIGSLQGNYGNKYNASSSNGSWNVGQPAVSGASAELKPGMFCANNSSGILTLKFTNQNSDQNAGWEGDIITFVKSNVGCNIDLTADNTSICTGENVLLTASGNVVSPSIDTDFNNSQLGSGWSASPGSLSFMSVLSCQPNNGFNTQNSDNSIYAWMQNTSGTRTLETNGFDVSGGGWMSYDFREASDDYGGNGCEALDDKEGVYVQYSTDNGGSWNTMKLMFPGRESGGDMGTGDYVYDWGTTTLPIPAGAMTANTKFRWIQFSNSGGTQDSWGIDNIKVSTITPPTITITDLTNGGTIETANSSLLTSSVSPTTTTTYRATISDGNSSCYQDITITVSPSTNPTFTQHANICDGETITLPAISNESITGSWSPAVDNTTTTTYTFTPDAGQCATTAQMTVTVGPPSTPTFTQHSDICSGESITLPTTSNESFTGTWSPVIDNTTTTTYTFTPDAGVCATTTQMTVNVNNPSNPTFNQHPDICSGESITLSTLSNESITGSWSPAIDNTSTTTYTFTPDAGQCATTSQMTINVGPPSTPTFTQHAPICIGGTITLSTSSNESFTGTWSPAIDNTSTTTYTFTPDAGQCATTAQMTVSVGPPSTPTFTQHSDICSGETITLPTTSNESFTGTWSPTADNTTTTTYTFTPDAGICATSTQMTVIVNNPVTPTFNQHPDICSGESITLPTVSNESIIGSWSPVIDNSTTTTYTFNPDAGMCANNTQMTVIVNQIEDATFSMTATCDGAIATITGTTGGNFSFTTPPSDGASIDALTGTISGGSPSTVYNITYTTNGTCSSSSNTSVTSSPLLIPTITCGATDKNSITFDWTIPSGASDFDVTYSVNGGSIINVGNTTSNSYTITGLSINNQVEININTNGSECYDAVSQICESEGCTPAVADFIFEPTTVTSLNPICEFTNLSENSIGYIWDFGDENSSTDENPSNEYAIGGEGKYNVILVAINEDGCNDTIIKKVNVKEELIYYIPNAFTPDGDKFNNEFKPVFYSGIDLQSYTMLIFNRYGQLIFESHDVDRGWKGFFGESGTMTQNGVYTYRINFKHSLEDNIEIITGTVNLLR